MKNKECKMSWVGSREHFVDQVDVQQINHVLVGRFGGNSSAGQYKNEDACIVWLNEVHDWETVVVMDAHNSSESAEIILSLFEENQAAMESLLSQVLSKSYFRSVENEILTMYQSESFLQKCRSVTGETAFLLAVRKGKYLYWFSVGDGILYLVHPELTKLNQYQVNQRHFYEWIGQVNTFAQVIPCYSSGVKELRKGENHLLITTDGLLEFPGNKYEQPATIFQKFEQMSDEEAVRSLLQTVQENNGRDSTTIVSWKKVIEEHATKASNH
ncbi:protein phosphatase 2C domain-containing protein [Paenisporosarcina cavernae]|nr:protein phosphatase 2C domain-containing protein [Paenisporosarcina cavernae]